MRHSTILGLFLVGSSIGAGQGAPFRVLNELVPAASPVRSAADFDHDGDADLFSSNAILVNDGSARFTHGPPFVVGAVPAGFGEVAGDVDGDLLPDLVSPLGVRLNDGALGFVAGPATPPLPQAAGATTVATIALADVDGDMDLDACLALYSSFGLNLSPLQPRLWINDGAGTFTDVTATAMAATTPFVNRVTLRDFDQDGDADVVLWNEISFPTAPGSPAGHHFLLVNGGGTFGSPTVFPGPAVPTRAAAGDVNADGRPDLVWSQVPFSGPTIDGVTLNLSPTSAPFVASPGTLSSGIVLADLQSSGSSLVIRAGASSITVSSVGSSGVINPPAQTHVIHSGNPIPSDLDGDGDLDLVTESANGARVLLNDNFGTLVPIVGHVTSPAMLEGVDSKDTAATGDVDGDGDSDLVFRSKSGPFAVARNDGHGNLVDDPLFCGGGACPMLAAAQDRVFPLDFDSDGDLDLYATRPGAFQSTSQDALYRNTGSGWTAILNATLPGVTTAVDEGDLDGDGDRDLVVGRRASTLPGSPPVQSFVAANLGNGVFVPASPLPGLHMTTDSALADLDGDLDLDLAQAALDHSAIYLNDGAGVFTNAPNQLTIGLSWSIGAGDLDGDGDVDLVIDDNVSFNSGAGIFGGPVTLPGQAAVRDVFDADDDGDLDLLMSNGLRLNDGTGNLGTLLSLPISLPAVPRADFDRDGDFDLVGEGPRIFSNTTRQIAKGSLARVGRTASLELYGPAGSPFMAFFAPASRTLMVPPWGTVFLDLTSVMHFTTDFFQASGTTTLSALVPPDPALVGLTFYWQVALPAEQRLTNLEVTTIFWF
jgi:hypothetical protein